MLLKLEDGSDKFKKWYSNIKDTKVKEYATARLTQANGAEVNLETLKLSILSGSGLGSSAGLSFSSALVSGQFNGLITSE